MPSLGLEIDDATLARAHAAAAARRTTLDTLLRAHLDELGQGLVAAPLPQGAARQNILMFAHAGRDTTARFLADGAWDEFEHPMPAYLYAWARAHPGLVIDGGANTGFYSLLAASAGPGVHVIAFEPDPYIRSLLQANIEANGLTAAIDVRPHALSDEPGPRELYVPPQDHGVIETSSSIEARFKSRFSEVLPIEAVTIDDMLDGGPAAVSVIKLDVAGHEMQALQGADRTIARHRPIVFAEVLDRADFAGLSRFVARHNYMDVALRDQGVLSAKVTVAHEGDAWNHAFVPSEQLREFLVSVRGGA